MGTTHSFPWNVNADLSNAKKPLNPKNIELQKQVSAEAN